MLRAALGGVSGLIWGRKVVPHTNVDKINEENQKPKDSTSAISDSLVENSEDPYSGTKEELEKFNMDLQKLLDKWIEKKLEIAGLDKIKHEKQSRINAAGVLTLEASVTDYLKSFFVKTISTPHQNIQKDLEQDHPLIQEWGVKLKGLFTQLAETKEEAQEKKIKLEICDAAIHMIEEIMKMVSDINRDFFICDGQIKGLSTAGETGVKAILLLITGMTFPSTDFGIEKFLRNEAYLNIQEDKKFVELDVTKNFATLIEDYEQLNTPLNDETKADPVPPHVIALAQIEEKKKMIKQEVEKLKEVKLNKFGDYSLKDLNQHKLQRGILRHPEPQPEEAKKLHRSRSFSNF